MGKVNKVSPPKSQHRQKKATPLSISSRLKKVVKNETLEKNDWEGATCPVCLEFPHNAVLLLCSSYHKGCRPYICATSRRFSNCLDQYKKAYTKLTAKQFGSSSENSNICLGATVGDEKTEASELLCPLCRGQVKGWTVVEEARKYLSSKKRACMEDNCSFAGNYKKLRKHVKAKHPLARPRTVDPAHEEKWKKLEHEREVSDVLSTIMSSTPGAMVMGDYVIEPYQDIYEDEYSSDDSLGGNEFGDEFFLHESFSRGPSNVRNRYHRIDIGEGFGVRRFAPYRPTTSSRGISRMLMRRPLLRRGNNRGGFMF